MKRISIQLLPDLRFEREGARESLGELLRAAADISRARLAAVSNQEGDRRREMQWIARWAIRAVAEEIIRSGKMPAPLAVRFVEPDEKPRRGRGKILHFGSSSENI
jgi:hypothetical protein